KLDGTEIEVWKGQDPVEPGQPGGISIIPVKADFQTNRLKVYLKSTEVPYWNEIDAVGLRDTAGRMHWVTAAEASSTYATVSQPQVVDFTPVAVDPQLMHRLTRMESDIRELKQTQQEMMQMVKELKGMVKELKRP